MKFLIDAQLPRRLAFEINNWGGDALHTLDLPAKNLTTDSAIVVVAGKESRVVVTKDSDFVDSFWLRGEPEKLLLAMLQQGNFVELSRNRLTLHS